MIKNLIFDFGQVMVRFERKYMVERFVADPEDSKLLQKVVFDRLYWDRLDAGTIGDEETLALVCERLPERLHKPASDIYYNWIYNIPEIKGMSALVHDMKEEFGVKVFLLSNISRYFASHSAEIQCLAEFDRCFFSAVCGKTKPNADFYELLCTECGILPAESVFIDDRADNVEAAEALGIHGYVFDGNASRLRNYLKELLARR